MLTPEAHKKWFESGETPSVDQMLELQKIGVVTAKEQQKLKESSRADNAHLFLAKQIDGYASTPFGEDYYWSHRFTGRVARVGFRMWSMRIAEAFWVQDELSDRKNVAGIDKPNDGHRTTYQFEWTNDRVLRAAKHIHINEMVMTNVLAPAQPNLVLAGSNGIDSIEQGRAVLWGDEDQTPAATPLSSSLLEAKEMSDFVSSADCDRLASDMLQFSASSMRRHFQTIGTSGTDRFI